MHDEKDILLTFQLLQDNNLNINDLVSVSINTSLHQDERFVAGLQAGKLVSHEELQQLLDQLFQRIQSHNWDEAALFGDLMRNVEPTRLFQFLHEFFERLPSAATQEAVRQRYQFREVHATGGLGRVWRVRDAVVDREIAIKELRPELLAHRQLVKRFLREAKLTAKLEHPNIVPVYDLFPGTERSRPFYSMRFLRGITMQAAIRKFYRDPDSHPERSIAFRQMLANLVSICNAVAYAHSRGIVHRDLKPSNVVLGAYGEILLIDWGLAKRIRNVGDSTLEGEDSVDNYLPFTAEEQSDSQKTHPQALIGTPAFMAPEQAAGGGAHLGTATDVYGLGTILFSILTGSPPHRRRPNESINDARARILSGPTPRVDELHSDAPQSLVEICAKAMAMKPADRYSDPKALGRELLRWLAGEPVDAFREPWMVRFRRWMLRHRFWTQFTAAILLLVFGIIATTAAVTWSTANQLWTSEELDLRRDTDMQNFLLQMRSQQLYYDVQFLGEIRSVEGTLQSKANKQQEPFERLLPITNETLQLFLRAHPDYTSIALTDLDNKIVTEVHWDEQENQKIRSSMSGPAAKWMTDPSLAEVVAKLKPDHVHLAVLGGWEMPNDKAQLFACMPVYVDNQRVGALGVMIRLGVGPLDEFYSIGQETDLSFATQEGVLLDPLYTDAEKIPGRTNLATFYPNLAPFFGSQTELNQIVVLTGPRADRRVAICRRSYLQLFDPPTSLVLIASRPLEQLDLFLEAQPHHRLLLGTIFLLLTALLAYWYLLRILTRDDDNYDVGSTRGDDEQPAPQEEGDLETTFSSPLSVDDFDTDMPMTPK